MSGDLEREIVTILAGVPGGKSLSVEELLYPLAGAMGVPRDRLRRDVHAVLRDLVQRGAVSTPRGALSYCYYRITPLGRERYAHALGDQRDETPQPATDLLEEVSLDTALAQWAEDVPRVLREVRADLAGGDGPRALASLVELRIDLAQLSARIDIEVVLGPQAWRRRPSALCTAGNSEE